MVPLGAAIFAFSISIDTIGHRTVYREEISKAEGLVHGITIFCGVGSCILLCAAYQHRMACGIPAAVLTALSLGVRGTSIYLRYLSTELSSAVPFRESVVGDQLVINHVDAKSL